jgi:hypothetical protein
MMTKPIMKSRKKVNSGTQAKKQNPSMNNRSGDWGAKEFGTLKYESLSDEKSVMGARTSQMLLSKISTLKGGTRVS